MRKVWIMAVIFTVCALPALANRTTIRIWVDCDGGNGYDYKGDPTGFPSICTPGTCNDCIVLIYQPTDGNSEGDVTPNPTGGYVFKGRVDEVTYTNASDRTLTTTTSSAGLIFSEHFRATITGCAAYPFLEGMTVNMKDITVDANGNFQVFFPVIR
jgi:hypothetical protein